MRIAVAANDWVLNNNPLPVSLIEQLTDKHREIPDVSQRLMSLPEIQKGINRGKLPASNPHENAVRYAEQNDLLPYIGYRIEPDRNRGGLQLVLHSFCVDPRKSHVVEPTKGIKWGTNVRYIGRQISRADYAQLRFLHNFQKQFK